MDVTVGNELAMLQSNVQCSKAEGNGMLPVL